MRYVNAWVLWLYSLCARYLAARGLLPTETRTGPAASASVDPNTHRVLNGSSTLYWGADFAEAKAHYFRAKSPARWLQGQRVVREK